MTLLALAIALYGLTSCGGSDEADLTAEIDATSAAGSGDSESGPPEGRPALLSQWGQLAIVDDRLVLADGVVPYTLNSALFSDYAHKLRTVWLPGGSEPATYEEDAVFGFPVGTVITKTFYFPLPGDSAEGVAKVAQPNDAIDMPLDLASVRLLETRILVHREDGWHALPYVWNEDQTDAELARVGDLIMLTLVDDGATETEFPYVVPNVNQCANCHAVDHTAGVIEPIGPKARHLNLMVDLGQGEVSQLAHWEDRGLLADAPAEAPRAAAWDDAGVPLDERARAYLDINCAHCHNTNGPADTSGLFLEPANDVDLALGICKLPIAAGTGTGGRRVGIQPGEPDESIFVFRMETTDPAAMMPELGRALEHTEGVALIADWITSLDGDC